MTHSLAMIQETGAAAGLAAVAGLAVLSALYVSHAREVKRLRAWAGRAPERARPQRPISKRIDIRYVAVALVGLLAFGGAATYGAAQLTGDGGNAQHNKPKRNGAAVKPDNVTVAVLNGTTVPGLAAMLGDQVAAAGFKKGTINNFPDQQLADSVVEYAPGHQAEASAVSRTVGINQRAPISPTSRALGGDATVIVVAGADKAP